VVQIHTGPIHKKGRSFIIHKKEKKKLYNNMENMKYNPCPFNKDGCVYATRENKLCLVDKIYISMVKACPLKTIAVNKARLN